MKNARVIAWLNVVIVIGVFMVGFTGAATQAVAKPKMPSCPRVSGEIHLPSSHAVLKPKMPSYPRVSGESHLPTVLASVQFQARVMTISN
mgnify:CR=1 FL=1